MSFDKSRFTFNPRKDYAGVVMQQGRVQLDSDWNEWLAELIAPHAGRHTGHARARGVSGDDAVRVSHHGIELRRDERAEDRPRTLVRRRPACGESRRSGDRAMGPGARRDVEHAAAAAGNRDRRNRLHEAAVHATGHQAARRQRAVPGVSRRLGQTGRLPERSGSHRQSGRRRFDRPPADGVAGPAVRSRQQSGRDLRLADLQLAAGAVRGAAHHGHDADSSLGSLLPHVGRRVHGTGEPVLPRADPPAGRSRSERGAADDRARPAPRSSGRATTARSSPA